MTFGQESSEMLGSIQVIFDDTLQRAENWIKSIQSLSLPIMQHIKLTPNTPAKEDDGLPSIQSLHIS